MQARKFLFVSLLAAHVLLGQWLLAGPGDDRLGLGPNGSQGNVQGNVQGVAPSRLGFDPGSTQIIGPGKSSLAPEIPAKSTLGAPSPAAMVPALPKGRVQTARSGIISAARKSPVRAHMPMNLSIMAAKPLVSIETVGPAEINVGKTASFTITLRNTGDSLAEDVVVEAVLPATAELQMADPKPEYVAGRLQFIIGDLPPKSMKQLTLEIVPQQPGAIDLSTRATVSTSTKSVLQVREPKLAMALTGPKEILYGELIRFQLVVTNTGDGPAEKIRFRLGEPKDSLGNESTPAAASFQQVPANIDLLPAGRSRKIELLAKADMAGPIEAAILATGDGGIEAGATAQLRVLRPMLQIKTEGPKIRYLDRVATYGIRITNPGDAPAERVTVTAVIPSGMKISAIEKRARFDRSGSVRWTLEKIAPGANELLRFRAKVTEEGQQACMVTASAEHGLSAQATHVTEVFSIADVVMTLRDTVSAIEVGEQVEFEIRIKNRGTKTATNVIIRALLADELEPVSSPGQMVEGQEVAFEPIPELVVGAEKVLKFRTLGRQPGDHVVEVTLQSESLRRDLVALESTFFYASDTPAAADGGQ